MLRPRLMLSATCSGLSIAASSRPAPRRYSTHWVQFGRGARKSLSRDNDAEAKAKEAEAELEAAAEDEEGSNKKEKPGRVKPLHELLRTYKPRTPGTRHLRHPINDHLWKGRPFIPLTFPKKGQAKGGRNVYGRITVRHRGGGAKRRIRTIDFERTRPGPHLVERIEYDPGRSAHIALVSPMGSEKKSYIIAAEGLRAGDIVHSYRAGIPQELLDSMGGIIDPGVLASKTAFPGNCLPMHMIPVGTVVFCVGHAANRGAIFCRSAGSSATVVNKYERTKEDGTRVMTGNYVDVQLQSGEIRRVSKNACATIGVASNPLYRHRSLGKAGRARHLNKRPSVRGVAMNKVDHPHGGGRGKSKSNRHPVTPWGRPTKSGWKTRKHPNRWVVKPRLRRKEKREQNEKKSA